MVGQDIIGLTSTHSAGSATKQRGWTLSFSGVAQGERRWAGVGILTNPQLSAAMLEFSLGNEKGMPLCEYKSLSGRL